MRVLIVGANGWIGSRLVQHLTATGMSVFTMKASMVVDWSSILLEEHALRQAAPNVIVNAAGYTGKPNVDDCLNNIQLLNTLNVFLPVKLAQLARKVDAKLVHISSGCLFTDDGDRFFDEDAEPNFIGAEASLYSNSKYDAEQILSASYGPLTILRPRMIFDSQSHPKNLIDKILKYKKLVPTVKNSMTDLNLLLRAVEAAATLEFMKGIYNVVNEGALTFEDIARIASIAKLKPLNEFKLFESKAKFDASVKEPRSFCTLSCAKLKKHIYVPELVQVLNLRMEQYKKQAS